jgi:DNA-binding Lrp family transcriptional regulator
VAGIALDRIDFEIIRLLQNDGRMANKVLARAVGLAPSSCLARVRRLVDDGVITGFRAEIDRRALGDALEAIIAVRLERHHRDDIDAFVEFALGLPETVAVTHVAGPTDILVHVAVADSDRLRDLVMDSFTTRPEVARFETSLVYSHQTGRR